MRTPLTILRRCALLASVVIAWSADQSVAADRRLVEIQYEGRSRTGTVIAHNQESGWFLEPNGRLEPIVLQNVADYTVRGQFRALNSVQLREKLQREFGNGYSVSTTGHYVVVSGRGQGERYAQQFEDLYRQFVVTFAAKGFRMQEPEFPLVAIVFPDDQSFLNYCAGEGVRPQPGLAGYYLPTSNRVAMFDTRGRTATDLDDTIIHEATHQVAFNTGVHSRIGVNPKWIVEGLATVFEVTAMRANDRSADFSSRLNPERSRWFANYLTRRPRQALVDMIRQEEGFQQSALDAYSQAWALTFFFLETRPTEYCRYLKTVAARDPFQEYTADQRLKDFQTTFGQDLALFDAHFVRFFTDRIALAP